MDNVGTTDTLYLAHRVKQLKILEHSMFLVSLEKTGKTLSMLRPKWARPVIVLTIPPTPKSLYSLTLLHWPLQTEPWYRGPGGEGREDRHATESTSSLQSEKLGFKSWAITSQTATVSSFLNLMVVFKRHSMSYTWPSTQQSWCSKWY